MSEEKITELKTLAKEIKQELGIKHQQALDEAARRSGYLHYCHARQILLQKPHEILFGVDIKHYMEVGVDSWNELGIFEHATYWDRCYEIAQESLEYPDIEYWPEENDWLAMVARPPEVKTIKDAIEFIRGVMFHPPEFILFDGMIIELDSFTSDNYLKIPNPDYDGLPRFLHEEV